MKHIVASCLLMIASWLLVADQQQLRPLVIQAECAGTRMEEAAIVAILETEKNLTPKETWNWLRQLFPSKVIPTAELLEQNVIDESKCSLRKLLDRYTFKERIIFNSAMDSLANYLNDRYNKQMDFCLEKWAQKGDEEILTSVFKLKDGCNYLDQFHLIYKSYESRDEIDLGPLDEDDLVSVAAGKLRESQKELERKKTALIKKNRSKIDKCLRNYCEKAITDLQDLMQFLKFFQDNAWDRRPTRADIGPQLTKWRELHDYCVKLLRGPHGPDKDFDDNFEDLPIEFDWHQLAHSIEHFPTEQDLEWQSNYN